MAGHVKGIAVRDNFIVTVTDDSCLLFPPYKVIISLEVLHIYNILSFQYQYQYLTIHTAKYQVSHHVGHISGTSCKKSFYTFNN